MYKCIKKIASVKCKVIFKVSILKKQDGFLTLDLCF